ncbi:MAG: hypothetical protein K6F93_06990, partial [Lachnospiraceae bacterium]|nr:hypothetical protein [Lachnospiraceae bacterium]
EIFKEISRLFHYSIIKVLFACVKRMRFLEPDFNEVPSSLLLLRRFFVALWRVSKSYYITRLLPCQQQYLVF